ncbi:hypothetical protein PCASD_21853 [Puccinia coronata f. sp. avenae]|uniref:Uncharacterized protein n=1 Tax=Puccinia coronata f. sp. avenae TaxID=200324 RepID=A0A2N5S3J2_9BASI|nr:hypothetical protein PCASD_21853 [Puccinia coronata f. sp. avenae]
MHIFILAFPLTLVVIGAVCYKRAKDREKQLEGPPVEGYYVYPTPPPAPPGHNYWMTPGAVEPQGYPHYSPPFNGPQPAPYNPALYAQHSTQPPYNVAPESLSKSSSQDAYIRNPEKVAQPGISNASHTISSEKMLVRDDASLLLPSPMPRNIPLSTEQDPYNTGQGGSPGRNDTAEMLAMRMRNTEPSVSPGVGSATAVGRGLTESRMASLQVNQPEDQLPRYTSGDAEIFQRYQNRASLKQDHSYIGRLRDSYTPPDTLAAPRRIIRDDSSYLKSSPDHPAPKP